MKFEVRYWLSESQRCGKTLARHFMPVHRFVL